MNIEDISLQDLKRLRPDLYALISDEAKESLRKDSKKASTHKEQPEQETVEANMALHSFCAYGWIEQVDA